MAAPGAGSGGVGIEGSRPATHFVIYAGIAPASPKETLDALERTLSLREQPEVTLHGIQVRQGG